MPQPAPYVRDLRLLARGGGHPPARRPDRPRRPALVGPAGLPHRGLRPDARAADQERGDRARGRQGRLLPQEPPTARRRRGRAHYVTFIRSLLSRHRQPGRRRGRAAASGCACATATTPTWSSPPTRARRRSRTPPTASRRSTASGSTTRSPPAARRAMTTRRSASPPRARGSRSSATSRSSASTPRPTSSRSSASATCRGDVFGNGMLLSEHIRLVAAYDHRHIFIDPDPDAATGFAERKRLFELAALVLGRLRPRADLRGRRRLPAHARSRSRSRRRRARRSGIEDESLAPTDVIRAILRAPVDLLWNGGIGTVVKASTETDADAARPLERRDPRRRERAARQGRGRGRQPRLHAPRARRVRRRAAGASTPTSSTTRPASTAPTTRST